MSDNAAQKKQQEDVREPIAAAAAATKMEQTSLKVVSKLRALAVDTEPGESIGSEESLIQRFNVSRPTFRNAAAIVSQEQLLSVKRGPGGGYFARRPDSTAVAQTAAILLHCRKTERSEVLTAIGPIFLEMVELASNNQSAETRQAWVDYLKADQKRMKNGELSDLIESEMEFGKLLGKACKNNVLGLFLSVLYDFCVSIRSGEDLVKNHPEHIRVQWDARHKLAETLIDNDEQLAALYGKRLNDLSIQWMTKSMEMQEQTNLDTDNASLMDALWSR